MRQILKLWIQKGKRFFDMINDSYTAACAAQAAFFMMLSVLPLTSLLLAVTTYLPFSKEDVITLLMGGIPSEFYVYVSDIINDLYAKPGGTIISVSVIAIVWSASKGIAALIDGFNSMYGMRRKVSPFKARLIAVAYTVLFVVLFAFMMSAYVLISHYYRSYIHGIFSVESGLRNVFLMIRYVAGWLVFYVFILMLFVLLPGGFGISVSSNQRVAKHVKSQVKGAAFAAVAWLVITRLLILYIEFFPNFSVMYGSLAGIVIAMLWLYFCMYSLFVGAVINQMQLEGEG